MGTPGRQARALISPYQTRIKQDQAAVDGHQAEEQAAGGGPACPAGTPKNQVPAISSLKGELGSEAPAAIGTRATKPSSAGQRKNRQSSASASSGPSRPASTRVGAPGPSACREDHRPVAGDQPVGGGAPPLVRN